MAEDDKLMKLIKEECNPYINCDEYRKGIQRELAYISLRLLATDQPRPNCSCPALIGDVVERIGEIIDNEGGEGLAQLKHYLSHFDDWRNRGRNAALNTPPPPDINDPDDGSVH